MLALGLDIGGANLKAATSAGAALARPFELWRAPDKLCAQICDLIARLGTVDLLAVTMTAELADCFATKAEGVAFLLAAVEKAARGIPVIVWQTSGGFARLPEAASRPRAVAAANWHALATWAGRLAPRGRGLLVDIGSTTTDLIPLDDGRPASRGLTDVDRLLYSELVYSGWRRTPLCAVAKSVEVRGRKCPVAAELFATMHDVFLLLEWIPDDASDRSTADGRPATIACAHDRVARMVCCDRDEFDLAAARSIAAYFAAEQKNMLSSALAAVIGRDQRPLDVVVVAGSGERLACQLVAEHPQTRGAQLIRLAENLSPPLTEAACAYAVAVLAIEAS